MTDSSAPGRSAGRTAYGEGMRITHLGHACLLVEIADERILVDPGGFTPEFEDLRDLSAVVVTHQHDDHLDQRRVPILFQHNPGARLLADPGSVEILSGLGLDAEVFEGAKLGRAVLTPVGETHALIHDDIPRIPNVGVVFRAMGEPSVYHPGSLSRPSRSTLPGSAVAR